MDDDITRDAMRYRALRARLGNGEAWFNASEPYVNLMTFPSPPLFRVQGAGGVFSGMCASLDELADLTVAECVNGPPSWWPINPRDELPDG